MGSLAVGEEAKIRSAHFEELSCAQETEAKDRVALEVSVHQALQVMHADFQQEIADRDRMAEELKQSLLETARQCLGATTEMSASIEKNHNEHTQELDGVKKCLGELRAS